MGTFTVLNPGALWLTMRLCQDQSQATQFQPPAAAASVVVSRKRPVGMNGRPYYFATKYEIFM